jgi:L-fuculose-phosphate aldolase
MAAREDVGAVVHSHPPHAIALAAMEEPLRAVSHAGALFVPPDVPRFTLTANLIVTRELGQALARALGSHRAVLMRNHGVAVVGPNVEEAAIAAVLLEEACQIQLLTQAFGEGFHVSPPDQAVARRTRVFPGFIPSLWAYLVRQVCRRWPECERFAG